MKRYWRWIIPLFLVLVVQGLTGCSFKAQITVQLINGATLAPRLVDKMTVILEMVGGDALSAQTNTNGQATFVVKQAGTYRVTEVSGIDVTGGAVNAEGREFIKASPLSTAAACVEYTPATPPEVTVTSKGDNLQLQVAVPAIRKTVIIASSTVDTPSTVTQHYSVATAFPGRIVFSDISSDCAGGLYVYSSGSLSNMIVFGLGPDGTTSSFSFYSGGDVQFMGYNIAFFPINFLSVEVPGGGDWAISCGSNHYVRNDFSYDLSAISLDSLGRDGDGWVLCSYNYGMSTLPDFHYRFHYEVQKFENF